MLILFFYYFCFILFCFMEGLVMWEKADGSDACEGRAWSYQTSDKCAHTCTRLGGLCNGPAPRSSHAPHGILILK